MFSPNRGGIDLSITNQGPPFSSTAAIRGWPQQPTNRSPYSMQWNFFIQRQIMDDMTLDVGYVGSGTRKQIGYSPFNNALSPGPGAVQPRRLLPSFGDLDGGSNQYNGSYYGLQVKVQKRFSDGLQFNLNCYLSNPNDSLGYQLLDPGAGDRFARKPKTADVGSGGRRVLHEHDCLDGVPMWPSRPVRHRIGSRNHRRLPAIHLGARCTGGSSVQSIRKNTRISDRLHDRGDRDC
ncbi:MAG: hypothetical protein OXC19_01360 [Bryobacterales bacterium]|nr:hypothetical protein [Bryobacterales bacterium]